MSENLQYWINQNGTQSGPHTIEQLESMALDKAHTYVWHKGMDGWKRIDKIPELAHLTAAPESAAPQESAVEPIEADAIAEEPHEAPAEEEAAAPVHPNMWNQRCKCRHLCHKCPLKCSRCKPLRPNVRPPTSWQPSCAPCCAARHWQWWR